MMRLTGKLRKRLKRPLGKLIKKIRLRKGRVITVGDIVAYNLLKEGIVPDLMIYDNREKRKPVARKIRKALDSLKRSSFRIKNRRGTISEEAWVVIAEALKRKSKIIVEGEEDLLVLPTVLLAKSGSSVLYGQPNRGIVLIEVNSKKKKHVQKLVDEMEVVV